jgi:Gpi18-like mannosyltransferase
VIRRQIGWPSLGALPAPYLLAIVPTLLLGRPLPDALLVYVAQAGVYDDLSLNAGNPYLFIPTAWQTLIVPAGLVFAAFALAYWSRRTARSSFPLDARGLVFCALLPVLLAPYLLPKMHERYFYAADVFAFAFAFHWPRLWFAPVLMQVSSTLAYMPFLFHWNPAIVGLSFISNTALILILLREQRSIAEVGEESGTAKSGRLPQP